MDLETNATMSNDYDYGSEDLYDLLDTLNDTERIQYECFLKESVWHDSVPDGVITCAPMFDQVTCWPGSVADRNVVIPCFANLNGVPYDTRQNASRICHANGTWDTKADYNSCKPLDDPVPPPLKDYSLVIYFSGYSISLLALFMAITIFIYFKEMRCLRNKIHTNLFITYVLANFCWIVTATLQILMVEDDGTAAVWCVSVVFLHYFHLATFFWMFVEGLYLFVQVIATFSVENSCIKLRHYLGVGWGTPLLVVLLWAVLNYCLSATGRGANPDITGMLSSPSNPDPRGLSVLQAMESMDMPQNGRGLTTAGMSCPFMEKNSYEWIYIAPVLLVLGLNTFFLIWIMWVVITKLRSSTSAAHEHDHQNWKAAKALLVIIPLLGITYLITIAGPTDPATMPFYIFQHLRAFLLSTQGFAVTLPYCFLNTEVRSVLRTHWERRQMTRSFADHQASRGHSARNSISLAGYYNTDHGGSRKNSIMRFHSSRPRKSLSVTETTLVGQNGTTRLTVPLHHEEVVQLTENPHTTPQRFSSPRRVKPFGGSINECAEISEALLKDEHQV